MGSALPIAIGAGRSSIRASDLKIRAVEIARLRFLPVFCDMEDPIVRGRSAKTASFLDDRGESYGRKRLGGGGGGGDGMFHEGAGGLWGMEREKIGL